MQTPQRPTAMGELGEMPERFEQLVLPHLDAAYNLARWVVGSPADAEDIVQEAFLRALRFFDGFRGGDSRAWLLKIVRNTSYSWLRKNRPTQLATNLTRPYTATKGRAKMRKRNCFLVRKVSA